METAQHTEIEAETTKRADSAKRSQILDGACRVFLGQGFDAASMGAIAREAGVSKGTLYVYFKSKEELFEAIVAGQCQAQAEKIFALDDAGPEPMDVVLTRVGGSFARFLCQPGGVPPLRTVIAIADRMPELGAQFYATGPARGINSLQRYLEVKVAEGALRPHDCEVAAAQFIDSCLSLTFKPMLFNYSGPPDEAQITRVVRTAVETFLGAYAVRR